MSRCEALRLRAGFASLSVAVLYACVSSTGSPHAPAADASYDWHGLILAPFGTLLKDSPLALHEVLLFHDAAQGAGGNEDGDCYAIDGAPPPVFAGRRSDDYMMCFDHDRLQRIEASVRLPADGAAAVFAAACAQWLNGSAPEARAITTTDHCDGQEGATGFSARLGADPAQSTPAQSTPAQSAPAQSALTMTISLFRVPP